MAGKRGWTPYERRSVLSIAQSGIPSTLGLEERVIVFLCKRFLLKRKSVLETG